MALAFLAPQASVVPETPLQAPSTPPQQPSRGSYGAGWATPVAAMAGVGLVFAKKERKISAKSQSAPLAVPVLPEPTYRGIKDPLLGECDAGFDPLNLATTESPFGKGEDTYWNYREAEVKHGRLAMLATVGWLSSEELQTSLAQKLGLADDLAKGGLAPSLVNGGLGNLPTWFLPAVLVVSAWIEVVPKLQGNREVLPWTDLSLKYKPQQGRVPGDLSFDPLSLQGTLTAMGASSNKLHNAEVKHGRAAMLGITGFVLQEFITRVPVLDEDAISADRLVSTIDKGIDVVDKVSGLQIPDIPQPFPFS